METISTGQPETDDNAELHARRIQMSDGRYLIFFTFGEAPEEVDESGENV